MKKIILSLAILFSCSLFAQAQVLPSFQFGIKGGVNLSRFTTNGTFNSDNRTGYLAGFWARIGAAGINLQPEVYYASKVATITNPASEQNQVIINSIDVPVLVGLKFGALGVGGRVATGPMASFILDNNQSFSSAASSIGSLSFKNQAYAWQFGAGLDLMKLSVDLRYELGLTDLSSTGQKLNMFNLTAAYRLF